MNSIDTAWVAGVIEGEGTMAISIRSDHNRQIPFRIRLAVEMTDYDVIEAIHNKTGLGTIYGPYKGGGSDGKDHYKQYWCWEISKRSDQKEFLTVILPLLFERRTVQALSCLDMIDEMDKAAEYRKNFCPKGHSKPDCQDKFGKCKICKSEYYFANKQIKVKGGGI